MYMKDGDIADHLEAIAQSLRNFRLAAQTVDSMVRDAHAAADALEELAKDLREW